MNCAFFGHKDCSPLLKDKIKKEIIRLYKTHNVKCFFVGNNGNFDCIVQSILLELSEVLQDLEFLIILSRPDEKVSKEFYYYCFYPDCLDGVPHRFAISKRNDWLIKNSSFIITYTSRYISNSYKWVIKAQKRGLYIINTSDKNINFKL